MNEVKYIRTLDAAKKWVKVARKEIEEEELLGKVLIIYLELEGLLKDGKRG